MRSRFVLGMSMQVAILLGGLVACLAHRATAADAPSALTEVQSIYLERCGGCHGIQGHSAPREVPSLRDQVGYFLCLPESRAYVVRLPSIASSPLSDEQVADLMNFVVFELGGGPRDRQTDRPPYTAEEVGRLRRQPLNKVSLVRYRERLVNRLIDECGAPRSLLEYPGSRTGTPSGSRSYGEQGLRGSNVRGRL